MERTKFFLSHSFSNSESSIKLKRVLHPRLLKLFKSSKKILSLKVISVPFLPGKQVRKKIF